MASKQVAVLKFVGTVSLGLSTGTSYALSSLDIPSLPFPSASSVIKTFRVLRRSAASHLNALSAVSSTAFALAFVLSPRGLRHPYLVYTALFATGSRLSALVTPYIFGSRSSGSSLAAQRRAAVATARKEKQAARRMEASYEVLGEAPADEGATSPHAEDVDEEINGEEIAGEMRLWRMNQIVQTATSAIGFAMAVVGIWGDGVYDVVGVNETLVFEL